MKNCVDFYGIPIYLIEDNPELLSDIIDYVDKNSEVEIGDTICFNYESYEIFIQKKLYGNMVVTVKRKRKRR